MTLIAIAFGVVALILSRGFIEDTIVELGESLIHSESGHIQISRLGYGEYGIRDPGNYLITDPEQLRTQISAAPGIKDVLLRLSFSGLLNNGKTDWSIVGEGVEPDAEARLGTYVTQSQGRQLSSADRFGITIGDGVARALNLKPGAFVNLLVNMHGGAINVLEFEVVGIFQTFSKDYDAHAIRIPLAAAQELLGTSGAHLLVVNLEQTESTTAIAAALSNIFRPSGYEIKDWKALNKFYEQTVELYQGQFGFLVCVILLMLILTVGNTIHMNIHERLGEFGTMRACGAKSSYIFKLIVLESMILGIGGGVVGAATGDLLAFWISLVGIPMPPPPNADLGYISVIRLGWGITCFSALTGLLAAFVAAILPAFRAGKSDIADSLRQAI